MFDRKFFSHLQQSARTCKCKKLTIVVLVISSCPCITYLTLHRERISNAVETGLKAYWVTLISACIITSESAKASHSFRKFDHSIIKLARIKIGKCRRIGWGKGKGCEGGGGGGGAVGPTDSYVNVD